MNKLGIAVNLVNLGRKSGGNRRDGDTAPEMPAQRS